jgi:putative transposase
MALRWTAAGMLEAERQFRRIIGYRDLAKLAVAIERDLAHTTPVASPAEEAGAARSRAPVVPFTPVT